VRFEAVLQRFCTEANLRIFAGSGPCGQLWNDLQSVLLPSEPGDNISVLDIRRPRTLPVRRWYVDVTVIKHQ